MQLRGAQRRNKIAPLINRCTLNTERVGDFLMGTFEESQDVALKHGTRAYSMPSGVASPIEHDAAYPVRMPSDHAMGARIRTLRESRGWSQGELARRVGVARATVNQWESGRIKDIRLAAVLRLTEVLQTTLRYLVYGPSPTPTVTAPARPRPSNS